MSSAKVAVSATLESPPDESSMEDIRYHLHVLEKIRRGAERADAEGAMSNEQAQQRLAKWLDA